MIKNFLAYQGKKFRLEWYFDDQEKSLAYEYYRKLTVDRQKKIAHLFTLLGDNGQIFNEEKFIHEGDQIYAFKTTHDRFLCFFFYGAKIIITNAYEKKTRKMPPREKQRAIKHKEAYIKRCENGSYYG